MSHTDGFYEMDTPTPDGQFFVGASEFIDTNGAATTASAGAGLFSKNTPASSTSNFFANVAQILRRTGVFATPARVQEQFGTAASVPGPTAVPNTSGPEGTSGYPPWIGTTVPTLAGPVTGPIPKGYRINSIDVIYDVEAVDLTSATTGLTVTSFTNGNAPVVTNRIALANNGLSLVHANGVAKVINIAVPSPVFSTASDGETIINVNFVTPAGSSVKFYGVVLLCDFNLN